MWVGSNALTAMVPAGPLCRGAFIGCSVGHGKTSEDGARGQSSSISRLTGAT